MKNVFKDEWGDENSPKVDAGIVPRKSIMVPLGIILAYYSDRMWLLEEIQLAKGGFINPVTNTAWRMATVRCEIIRGIAVRLNGYGEMLGKSDPFAPRKTDWMKKRGF